MQNLKEAIGAVAGLFTAGYLVLLLSRLLGPELGINLTLLGTIYVLAAVLFGTALIIGIINSITSKI